MSAIPSGNSHGQRAGRRIRRACRVELTSDRHLCGRGEASGEDGAGALRITAAGKIDRGRERFCIPLRAVYLSSSRARGDAVSKTAVRYAEPAVWGECSLASRQMRAMVGAYA